MKRISLIAGFTVMSIAISWILSMVVLVLTYDGGNDYHDCRLEEIHGGEGGIGDSWLYSHFWGVVGIFAVIIFACSLLLEFLPKKKPAQT